jgi:LPS sulfotransferase NodH
MRSGSNAVCDLLSRNGMGAPTEWFQKPLLADHGEPWLGTFGRFIRHHQAEGMFGSKMSHDHRARLDESLRNAIPGYHYLNDILPNHHWVWLVRRDKVLQAVSLCRAENSDRWALTGSNSAASEEFEYDYFHILSRLLMIQAAELTWGLYFQQHGIDPYRIVYEDFFAEPESQFRDLVDYLGGLPPGRADFDFGQTFRMQRDEANFEVRERFIEDLERVGEDSFAYELGESQRRWMSFFFDRQWRSTELITSDGIETVSAGSQPRLELLEEDQPELHERAS